MTEDELKALRMIQRDTRTTQWAILQEDGSLHFEVPEATLLKLSRDGFIKMSFQLAYRITKVKLTARGRKAIQ